MAFFLTEEQLKYVLWIKVLRLFPRVHFLIVLTYLMLTDEQLDINFLRTATNKLNVSSQLQHDIAIIDVIDNMLSYVPML